MSDDTIQIEDWHIYRGSRSPRLLPPEIPPTPPWRPFHQDEIVIERDFQGDTRSQKLLETLRRGASYLSSQNEVNMVNAALHLRRPLLITGGAGTGKSSLAYSIAWELCLGPVLCWNVTSRSALPGRVIFL